MVPLPTPSDQPSNEMITLHPERCLNTRLRAIHCRRCIEACPAGEAITIIQNRPALDNAACLDCGLCLHCCPTGAFNRPDDWADKLVKTVAAMPAGPVDLVCPHHPEPGRGPAPQAVQVKRCLAALAPATLLEIAGRQRDLRLDDRHCTTCPLGRVQVTLVQTVAEATGWSWFLDKPGSISLYSRQSEISEARPRPVYEADRPVVSRRGFFSLFKETGQVNSSGLAGAEMIRSGKATPVSERLPHNLPRQRAKILSIVANQKPSDSRPALPVEFQPPVSSLPVANLTLDAQRCTACGLCARFCPTGALKFLSDGQSFALTFQPSFCLGKGCNACEIACPEQAITTRPAVISANMLTQKPLIAGRLTACRVCRQAIAGGPGLPETCFACRQKNSLDDLLKSLPL